MMSNDHQKIGMGPTLKIKIIVWLRIICIILSKRNQFLLVCINH
jgi:hypothetical protein